MRLALVAAFVLEFSAMAAAQSSVSRFTGFGPGPSIGLPLPSIGLPLPPIGLPLPPMGLPPSPSRFGVPPSVDILRSMNGNPRIPAIQRQRQFSGRGPGSGRGSGLRPTGAVIYFVPAWGWSPAEAARFPDRPSAPLPPEPQRLTGRLRLELQAGVVPQIYVDGYYVGTFDEFNGELILEAGPHRIELRADRYEPLQVDVQIFPDRSITYRGALKASAAPAPSSASAPPPAPPAAPASVTPPPPSTIYVIPGCYVGNLPPRDAGLRADCDERLTIEFPPRP